MEMVLGESEWDLFLVLQNGRKGLEATELPKSSADYGSSGVPISLEKYNYSCLLEDFRGHATAKVICV